MTTWSPFPRDEVVRWQPQVGQQVRLKGESGQGVIVEARYSASGETFTQDGRWMLRVQFGRVLLSCTDKEVELA